MGALETHTPFAHKLAIDPASHQISPRATEALGPLHGGAAYVSSESRHIWGEQPTAFTVRAGDPAALGAILTWRLSPPGCSTTQFTLLMAKDHFSVAIVPGARDVWFVEINTAVVITPGCDSITMWPVVRVVGERPHRQPVTAVSLRGLMRGASAGGDNA